jgi:TRAP-type mannitol/chloroaromatic compound transport system permease small subunit
MTALADTVALWLHTLLPGWVRLPNLTFELPHLIYWSGLALFPLFAMYLVNREESRAGPREPVTPSIAYLLWLTGGFVGLHRFYLRASRLGFVYVALFVLILYGNGRGSAARNAASEARNGLKGAEFDVERFTSALAKGRDGAAEKLTAAKNALIGARDHVTDTADLLDQWLTFSGGFAAVVVVLLIVDAFLLPGLRRRCLALEADRPPPREFTVMQRGPHDDPRNEIHNPLTRLAGGISGWSGNFVAYWSVIAVFAYYYEVIARYVFNSPTNWVHESMFLMFGMQYLLSGAFALREDSHVRVDVVHEMLSERARALTDIVTSLFFFVFTLTLMVTGAIFALDSIEVLEVSFTEWAIQYWPVKITISLGALLITLQGLAKLSRDITYFRRMGA